MSSIDIDVIRKVFIFIFFYKRYSKHLKHEQKSIQVNISNIDTEVIRTVFIIIIFYKRYSKHLKHKQNESKKCSTKYFHKQKRRLG